MSGSGLNHNMNHAIKRIETRVLAPPGGFSSFSIGGGPSTSYQNHSTYKKSRASFSEEEAKPARNASNGDYSKGRGYGEQKENIVQGGARRGSFDGQGSSIPGLESHYSGKQANHDTAFSRNNRTESSSSKNDYAEMLRQQIALKKQMAADEENPYAHRSSKNSAAYDDRRAEEQNTVSMYNRRRAGGQQGGGGGQSSFSLAW